MFHLAQVNIARARAQMDAPEMADFVKWLEPINAIADSSPGFVWRLQTGDGNATSLRVMNDDMMLINMSVWESVEALHDFIYRTQHRDVFARRSEWFERLTEPYVALWWIRAGDLPTIADAEQRITHLRTHGPTPHAFTLKTTFPANA
jgi:hypothetical protein